MPLSPAVYSVFKAWLLPGFFFVAGLGCRARFSSQSHANQDETRSAAKAWLFQSTYAEPGDGEQVPRKWLLCQ